MSTNMILDPEGIDEASDVAASFLEESGLNSREVMAARLAFEDALLDIREELGDGAPMRLWVSRFYGRPRLLAAVQGKRVD